MTKEFRDIIKQVTERYKDMCLVPYIIANAKELEYMTQNDLPGILCLAGWNKQYQNKVYIRYIVTDDKPIFRYAHYGQFIFDNGELYIISDDPKLSKFHKWRTAERLFDKIDEMTNDWGIGWAEDFVDEETGDIETVHFTPGVAARQLFEQYKLSLVPALFAGIKTPFLDTYNGKEIYTGDLITVSNEKFGSVTGGIGVLFTNPQFGLIMDNCSLPLPLEGEMNIKKLGSLFSDLSPMMHNINVEGQCVGFAQSREDLDILLVMAKASPHYEQDAWEWKASIVLGLYDED